MYLLLQLGREHLQLYGRVKSAKWNWNAVVTETTTLLDKVGCAAVLRVCAVSCVVMRGQKHVCRDTCLRHVCA